MNDPVVHTKPDERVVVYLATRNLYDDLPAAFSSLLAHTQVDHVYLLIDDDRPPFRLPENVSCVNVSGQTFFDPDGPNYRTKFTYMALMKAALSKIFPDLEKCLVLDVDTIVHVDISSLWAVNMENSFFAAVQEPRMSKAKGYPYFNFGVVMLNLQFLRETGVDDEIISALNRHKYTYPEQDAFAIICGHNRVTLLPDYNVTKVGSNCTGEPEHLYISHFTTLQNWCNIQIVQRYTLAYNDQPRYVCYMGNRKYYPMLITAAKSLLSHSPVDRIFLLIEDDTFPEPLPSVFECINVSRQDIFPLDGPNIHPHYTYMTAMRAALTKILPGYVDRVLLLDPDTVVMNDISAIWNYDITGYYFAAVQETRNNDHEKKPYYNAGAMLMNLHAMRITGMDDKIIREMNTTHYKHIEQDVLNFLCAPYILDLPSHYNASFVSDPCRYPKIMHFLSFSKKFLAEAQAPYVNKPWDQIQFAQEVNT